MEVVTHFSVMMAMVTEPELLKVINSNNDSILPFSVTFETILSKK